MTDLATAIRSPGALRAVPAIRARGLRKAYGEVVAVDGFDLDVTAGTVTTVLGPSGSGKTTVLRMLAGFEVLDRETPPTLDLGRRTGIAEVETGYEKGAAVRQAARCLVCHVQTIYDPEKCVLCSRCVDVCPEYCLAIVPFESLDLPEAERAELEARAEANGLPLSAMIKDDDRCIRCGLCAVRCPTDAMTMERFQIQERFAPPATAGEAPAKESA